MAKKIFLEKYNAKKYMWFKDTKSFVILIVIVFFIFQFIIGASKVEGVSMLPTLHENQVVFYLRIGNHYKRGDVVPVRMPSGDYYVKRIIGIDGDVVDIRGGNVYVNDEKLDEPYIQGVTEPQDGDVRYPVTVKPGQVFVMGDNREESMDSRAFGPVIFRQLKGKILFHIG